MANSNSAKKRIRQNAVRRLRNRYQMSTTRTAIKRFDALKDKSEAEKNLPEIIAMVDKAVKNNLWHKNKGARIKSQLFSKLNDM